MSPLQKITSSLLFCGLLSLGSDSALALTAADIAGVYQGTSVATLPGGQTATAQVTITLKPNGKEKVVATANGQISRSKGRFQFVSDDVIVGDFPTSEFTSFVDQSGETLTLTVLAKSSTGVIVSEVTTLTLVEKL